MFKKPIILWICVLGLSLVFNPLTAQKPGSKQANLAKYILNGQIKDEATGQI